MIWVPKKKLLVPRTPQRQRGFLLSPWRFGKRIVPAAASMDGAGNLTTFSGAAVAEARATALDGVGTANWVGDRAAVAPGAMSSDGAGSVDFAGGAVVAGDVNAAGTGAATFAADGQEIKVDAADFDGATDKLTRSSALAGQVDSKKGILSFWVSADSVGGNDDILDATGVSVRITTTGALRFALGAAVLWTSAAGVITNGSWNHVLFEWDVSIAYTECYLNGTQLVAAGDLITNVDVGWAAITSWTLGGPINPLDAGVADFWFAPAQFVGITNASVRRRFRSDAGKPVGLGGSGDIPTGSAPLIYLHLDDGEAASNFAQNRTGAGNFTVTGALTTYPSSPSD